MGLMNRNRFLRLLRDLGLKKKSAAQERRVTGARAPAEIARRACLAAAVLGVSGFLHGWQSSAQTTNPVVSTSLTNTADWISRPMSLADALNTTLERNSTIVKAKDDLEATRGVIIQTRAIALPQAQITGKYLSEDPNSVEQFPFSAAQMGGGSGSSASLAIPHQTWNTGIRVVQSIYEGGKVASALRAARLTRDQSVLQYQTTVADTLLSTRVAYYDVLLSQQQIVVEEASVNLLGKELEDQQRRFDAGTVPRFNVLRAEVAVANERPALIRAHNDYRIAKNNLANLLGFNVPHTIWEDIPLNLTGRLEAEPYQVDLPTAINEALAKRTELAALQKTELLRREDILNARSGYRPSVQAFAGYSWQSPQFMENLTEDFHGWNVGAQLTWNIFDGLATHGRVVQARALHDKAEADLDDTSRRIELEVRTDYSAFIEARELLDSQQKVQEEAEEALRLARARAEAGTGTQLDVLDARTSLTQAQTTQIQALHDYEVARARLERAIGRDIERDAAP
jgi:outer membrane protein TolC